MIKFPMSFFYMKSKRKQQKKRLREIILLLFRVISIFLTTHYNVMYVQKS